MSNQQHHSEASAQEAELLLLRAVFESARSLLRFNGVDGERTLRAYDELDRTCEQVKLFDGGCMEDEDIQQLVEGGPLLALVMRVCQAYEAGYGKGLQLSGGADLCEELYTEPRLRMAYRLGYRKGAALSNRQGVTTPQAIRNEGDRSTFGGLVLKDDLERLIGDDHAVAAA